MLKLNSQQMDHFREEAARKFEERLVAHLAERFPLHAATIGPAGLGRLIERGIGSAALHGISKEKDVCRLIELMVVSGEGDAAPDDDWMAEVLDQATPANISARLEQLSAQAAERLSKPDASGPADPAAREEAAAGLSSADERPFDDRAGADDPVRPCPNAVRKRLCSFSS